MVPSVWHTHTSWSGWCAVFCLPNVRWLLPDDPDFDGTVLKVEPWPTNRRHLEQLKGVGDSA